MSGSLLFAGWDEVLRIVISAVVGYAVLLVLLRGLGKRTIAKMNMSDFVITVAVGSTLAAFIASRDIPIVDGIVALAVLVGLQYLVLLVTRWPKVREAVEGDPTLLVYRGRFLRDMLAREHVAESELRQAIRSDGLASLDDVRAVVLEVDGNFTVIPRGRGDDRLLGEAIGAPEDLRRRAG